MDRFVELALSLPWASKLRKSYKRLSKVQTHEEKWETLDKFIIRAVRLVGKHVGENIDSFEDVQDLNTVLSFLKELVFVLNEENTKLNQEFEEFDDRVLPILLKYVDVSVFIANQNDCYYEAMEEICKFLMSLPHHAQSAISKKARARSLLELVHSKISGCSSSSKSNEASKRKHVDTPMPPRKKSEKFTDMETNPQEEMDPDSTLTLEATNSPLRVMTSTPNSKLTSSVTGTVTAETKFKTLQSIPIDLENREEEVDISNTSNTVPVSESIIEIVPNESDETEEKEIQDVDDEIDDAEIIPPSPASSSSFRLFSSAKLSFSRNVVLPQCIIPREKAELSPRYVVETPEPPELPKLPELTEISSDSQEIVSEKKTVIALIHAPPKSLMTSDFDSIEGISPINWENSGLNDNVDANSTQGNDIQTSQELNATVTCPIQESQIAPKDEEASVPSADVTISLENSQAVPDPFKDLPVQLSALQALLRKRFRNPFITPTEKLHYKFQRRLGRLKRRPLRPVWTITKRRVSVTPPNIDDNNNSAAVQSCKNDSNDLSQSLLTKELDRSLRNLEREEAGMASEGGSQQCNVSQNDIDVSMSKEFSKISKTSSDPVRVKQELFAPVAASSDGYRSPDSGCEVHNEESCLFVKTEQESSVKDTVETIEDVTPKSETTDLLKGSEEATTCDLLGCSMSDSDDLLENIRSNVAAWVTREEDCNQGPAVDDEPNGQLFPPLLFANPADDVKPNIKSMEESPKMSSSLPKSDPQPKEYIRRSVRLASARNSPLSSSASQSSGTSSRKRRASTSAAVSEYEELKTGSGLVKVARMIVWDEFVKYLPPCWVDLLQEHVRDCNSTRQFLINSNPGGPSPIIICKCSHPRPKCD